MRSEQADSTAVGPRCAKRLASGITRKRGQEPLQHHAEQGGLVLRAYVLLQLRASNVVAGNETLEALRHRQRLEARTAEEEDLMVRVPLSKEQKKQLKADRRLNLSGAAAMNDFADDVADLVGVSLLSTPYLHVTVACLHTVNSCLGLAPDSGMRRLCN